MKLSKSNIEIQKLLLFQKFLHTIAVVEVNHVIERKAYLDALRRWRDKRVIKVITGIRRINALEWLIGSN